MTIKTLLALFGGWALFRGLSRRAVDAVMSGIDIQFGRLKVGSLRTEGDRAFLDVQFRLRIRNRHQVAATFYGFRGYLLYGVLGRVGRIDIPAIAGGTDLVTNEWREMQVTAALDMAEVTAVIGNAVDSGIYLQQFRYLGIMDMEVFGRRFDYQYDSGYIPYSQ